MCTLSNSLSKVALWEWCYAEYWMGSGYEHDGEQYPWTQVCWTTEIPAECIHLMTLGTRDVRASL
jgi:hypothetical protein